MLLLHTGLKSISRCSKLSVLKLGICLNITDEGLAHVGMCCSKLKELDLYRFVTCKMQVCFCFSVSFLFVNYQSKL